MGGSLYSKLIYYWIFIFGGLTVSYLLNMLQEGMDFIILLVALTLVYWGMEFLKARRRQKRGEAGNQPQKGKGRKSSR